MSTQNLWERVQGDERTRNVRCVFKRENYYLSVADLFPAMWSFPGVEKGVCIPPLRKVGVDND